MVVDVKALYCTMISCILLHHNLLKKICVDFREERYDHKTKQRYKCDDLVSHMFNLVFLRNSIVKSIDDK